MLNKLIRQLKQIMTYLRESVATETPKTEYETSVPEPPLSVPDFLGTPTEKALEPQQPEPPNPAFELGSSALGKGSGTPENPQPESDRERRRKKLAALIANR